MQRNLFIEYYLFYHEHQRHYYLYYGYYYYCVYTSNLRRANSYAFKRSLAIQMYLYQFALYIAFVLDK